MALALVLNLATNTVEIRLPWWPAAVWSLALVLVAAAIWAELRQDADDLSPEAERVFGAIPYVAQHFQSRPRELGRLRRTLGVRGKAALVALPGERGAGKSQLAAVYARECLRDGYELVAWINAESGPVTDLSLLGGQLGLGGQDEPPEGVAMKVRSWLQNQRRGRRLLVFDNVDDPDAMTPYLPRAGTTKILVTTNRGEFARLPGFEVVPVGMFTSQQGREFLQKVTGLPDDAPAEAVGAELGWLPLGLAQASAYIAERRLSYAQYLAALAGQDLDDALRRTAGTDHPGVLRATQLSMAGLDRRDPSGDSARLLVVLAVLSPDGIGRAMLAAGEEALGLAGGLVRALGVLANASLIRLSGSAEDAHGRDGVMVMVHRLTARVIRYQAGTAGAIATATDLLDLFTDDFGLAEVAHRRAELDDLAAHVTTLCAHSAGAPSPLLLTQMNWTGLLLLDAGDLTRAAALFEESAAARERVLGGDHPDTLASRHNVAYVYESMGRLAKAIGLYERVLADSEQILGGDHPDTLVSRHNLASVYRSAGRLEEALDLHERVLADRVLVLGGDHPNTLESRHGLAYAYESVGRLDEAIDLYQQVLDDRLRMLGEDHPDTLVTRDNLAGAYQSAGRLDEAIDLHREVLADRVRVLGADHPDALLSRSNLAEAYDSAGRLDEAIDLLERVLADCERVLSADHPMIAHVRENLALAKRRRRL
ncbi:MAG TPA: tetratricopeptide repeat protein [Candidatus Limnocylindrales bacterium]